MSEAFRAETSFRNARTLPPGWRPCSGSWKQYPKLVIRDTIVLSSDWFRYGQNRVGRANWRIAGRYCQPMTGHSANQRRRQANDMTAGRTWPDVERPAWAKDRGEAPKKIDNLVTSAFLRYKTSDRVLFLTKRHLAVSAAGRKDR